MALKAFLLHTLSTFVFTYITEKSTASVMNRTANFEWVTHPKQTGLKWFAISWKILVLSVSKTLNFGSTLNRR